MIVVDIEKLTVKNIFMKLLKKVFLVIALAGAAASSSYSQSGKGDVGLGFNLGVGPSVTNHHDFTNFGLGAKVQYNFTNPIRGEFEFTYWFESDHISFIEAGANIHYLFNVSRVFTMYPIVGIGYGQPRVEYHDGKISFDRFMFNIGLGGEFNVARNWTASLEVKFQYMKDFSRMPITAGLTYHF